MDYKKHYEELLDVMLNSGIDDLESIAKRIKNKVLKLAVEEEFKFGFVKVQEASLISPKAVIEQARLWFGYHVDEEFTENSCYDFIKANDFDIEHIKFFKDNWDDIHDIYGIIVKKLDDNYWYSLQYESKKSFNEHLDPTKEEFDYEDVL